MAAPATAQSPGTDSVAGAADECVESFEPGPGQIMCARRLSLDVDVQSGPAGENPTGTVRLDSVGLTPGGSVTVLTEATCLSVRGRAAIAGVAGTYRQGGFGFEAHLAGLIRVVDGGEGAGADTVEFAYQRGDISGPPLPGPTTCSTFPGTFGRDLLFFPDFTNATGDVVVTDTLPVPTSRDQCRHGAWQQLGYDSHQECVRAAEHLARQECVFIRAAHGRPAFRATYGSGVHERHAMRRCIRERSSS
jgi:hypothetical protein